MTVVGYATLQIIPSANGFAAAISGQISGSMAAAGAAGGRDGGKAAGVGMLGALKGFAGPMAAVMGGIGIANLIGDSVKLEAEFTRTLNTMAAVAGVPAAELKNLSALALKMGADTSFSANEAADAMLELAKGGISAADISAGALAGTLTLAAAGGTDLATAATIASNAMNAFGLTGSKMNEIAAALAGGANASTASIESLGEALSQVGPGAVNAGLNLQETVAVLAAFDSAGIKGSDAGTSLKTMLTRLVPATDSARAAMAKLGLNFIDAHGNFLPITNVAEQLKTKLSGLSEAQRTLALSTIFGSDAQRAASVLMNEGAQGIEQFIKATSDMNAAQAVADARMSGTAGALDRMGGAIETAKLAFGRLIAPAVTAAAEGLARTFGWIADSLSSIGGGGLSNALGGLTKVGDAFRALGKDDGPQAFGELLDNAFGNTGEYVGHFRDIGSTLLNIKDTVISAGRSFAEAFGPVRPLLDDLRSAVQERFAVVMDIIRDLLPVFDNIKTDGAPVFAKLGEAVRAAAEVIVPAFRATTETLKALWALFGPTVVSIVKNTFGAIWGVLSGAFTIIKGVFEILKGLFTGDWALMWEGVKNVFAGAWEAIKAVIVGALQILWDLVVRLFGGIGSWIAEKWNALVEWFVSTTTALPGRIWAFVQSIPTLFKEAIESAAYWVGYGIGSIVKFFIELPGKVWATITELWDTAVLLVTNGVNATVAWFLKLVTDAYAYVQALPGRIWATIRSLWDTATTLVREGIEKALEFFRSLPGKAADAASSLPQRIWDVLVLAVDKAKTIGVNIVQGIIDGLKSMWDNLTGIVGDIADSIADGFKDALGINSPSKVFKGLGGFLMQGLALGITGDTSRVTRAMRAVSDGLANARFPLPVPAGGVAGALAAVGTGSGKTLNYYAAPGNSIDSDEDLFAAGDRARMVW